MVLEQQGIPTAAVISTPFRLSAAAYVKTLGLPDLPILITGHPMADVTGELVQERAAQLTEGALSALIGKKGVASA